MNLSQKIYNRIAKKGKYLLSDAYAQLGFGRSFFSAARGSRILAYHGICKSDHLKFNTLFLTEQTFEAHLKFFTTHFNVVSLDDYYSGNFSNDRFNVCLTFDDGFANNY